MTKALSRRAALKLGGTLLTGTVLPQAPSEAHPTITIGDPNHPAALPTAIVDAYTKGHRDITVAPGVYVLPATGTNSIEFTGWTNATLRCKDVTIIFEEANHRPVMLIKCTAITLEDATLQFADLSYTQGRITMIAEDKNGKYVEWQIDAGCKTDIDPRRITYSVIDHTTRLLKVGTGDSQSKEAETIRPGLFRLYKIAGMMEGVVVGDWLVCRANGGTSIIQLDQSKNCTMRRIILKNSGFAAFFETGGDGGHYYSDCRVTRGPRPSGATEEQLVSCGADGFHSTGTKTGPTIDGCIWDGVLLDDCIAIHGSFQKVIRAEANKLVLESGNRAGFAVDEPVRISSNDGFFNQATCTAMRTLDEQSKYLELTLDRPLLAPANSKAGNPDRCGRSYKIVHCTLGNTRSRGILVKADDGLIQDCMIEGCGMSAVSIGPEYFWNEANYSWNITVARNTFRHNALRNSARADGVIFIHGDGAIGNRNITIEDNVFDSNYCPYMMSIAWADRVTIVHNVINAPSPLPLSSAGSIISLHDIRRVTLFDNTYKHPGAFVIHTLDIGKNVEGAGGIDDSGIRLVQE